MQKMAVFVEGRTEQLFVEKLLLEIAGASKLVIEEKRAVGRRGSRSFVSLIVSEKGLGRKYFVVIVNCESDSSVKSDIREQYDKLVSSGYEVIIGLRDAYPAARSLADIPRLRRGLQYRIKAKPIEVLFVLSIMEIEAWFLSEYTHFEKLNRKLTIPFIRKRVGIDLGKDNIQARLRPSDDLHAIYKLAGLAYRKEEKHIRRTVNALDYSNIYLDMSLRIDDIGNLCAAVDEFVA